MRRPPGGTVFDPFTGSGSTGKAAVYEGSDFTGIARKAEYVGVARSRIAYAERVMAERDDGQLSLFYAAD